MRNLVFGSTLILATLLAATVGCVQKNKAPEGTQVTAPAPQYEIETKEIPYSYKGTKMIGYLARPKTAEKRPGVLVVHEWWGRDAYAKKRADMLAEQGYVAFALDMYGNAKTADTPDAAGALAGKSKKNLSEAQGKFEKAMATLKAQPQVDSGRIAAVGYCYGGGLILDMLRRGVDMDMAFSFHGTLKGATTAKKNAIHARVYAFNGAADPMVPKEQVEGFEKEMKDAEVTFESVNYEGALHAFSNPASTENGKKFNLPIAYDQKADVDSWVRTLEALKTL